MSFMCRHDACEHALMHSSSTCCLAHAYTYISTSTVYFLGGIRHHYPPLCMTGHCYGFTHRCLRLPHMHCIHASMHLCTYAFLYQFARYGFVIHVVLVVKRVCIFPAKRRAVVGLPFHCGCLLLQTEFDAPNFMT
jgi:hypothetical protein